MHASISPRAAACRAPHGRRAFLRRTSALASGIAALSAAPAVARSGADVGERVRLGFIGVGGMGTALLKSFASMPDVTVASVCDADSRRADAAAETAERLGGRRPRIESDPRRILDDAAVDAVVTATPDHWHAPMTILACEAGKHVYVEKPCCHNVREGRLMVEAARHHDRVVQVGTQSRSSPAVARAIELVRGGAIGKVLAAKAWNSQRRSNIGHAPPSQPPPQLDYDLWIGPTPMTPYQSNLLHANWRWFLAFGCGDMGNDGVHDLDIARWGLGMTSHPDRIAALGGKYYFDDDQQFPDTQYVVFEYGSGVGDTRQLIYEQRDWSPYVQEGRENGNAFYGTDGMLLLGKNVGGWQLYGPRNVLREQGDTRLEGTPHHRNFLDCIRSGARPNADIEIGHISSALCHLGNIATRLRRTLRFEPGTERFTGDAEADALLRRSYRAGHWAVPRAV